MGLVSYVSYGEGEKDLVRSGIAAMREVLMGGDAGRKRRLLLALDWFMDPYYRQDLSEIYDDLVQLLQEVVLSSEEDVAEDALMLLTSYAWPPFRILAQNLEKVPERLRAEAQYAVGMGSGEWRPAAGSSPPDYRKRPSKMAAVSSDIRRVAERLMERTFPF